MRIKSVKLKTFKRFSDLQILDLPETAKLVVVAGPNGNGKSSLFDAFLAFHHRDLSELGFNWQLDYHVKKTDRPQQTDGEIEVKFFQNVPTERSLSVRLKMISFDLKLLRADA
jgi:AAA15 family ATPase/GTPase